MSKLKPCPFCGNRDPFTGSIGSYPVVECPQCHANQVTGASTTEEAIANWNKRPGNMNIVIPPESELEIIDAIVDDFKMNLSIVWGHRATAPEQHADALARAIVKNMPAIWAAHVKGASHDR